MHERHDHNHDRDDGLTPGQAEPAPEIPHPDPPPPIPELLTRPVERPTPAVPKPSAETGRVVRKQAAAWALASNFAFGVIGLCLLGWAIEKWLWPAASPWLIMGGAALGILGGGYVFIRDAIRMNES